MFRMITTVNGVYSAFGPACRARFRPNNTINTRDMDYTWVSTPTMTLFPNPNRDGMVTLNMQGLASRARREGSRARAQLLASLRLHRRLGDLWRSASVLEAVAAVAANSISANPTPTDPTRGAPNTPASQA